MVLWAAVAMSFSADILAQGRQRIADSSLAMRWGLLGRSDRLPSHRRSNRNNKCGWYKTRVSQSIRIAPGCVCARA